MNLLRNLLWHLDTSRRARKARRTWPYDDDLMAVATAVGVVTPSAGEINAGLRALSDYLKERH